ncbi:MAG: two-component system, OmpR family, sensor kinase, partial [Actinomycetota bacterium]|nr:two-component system, OmpR family, sensor kinase [Actinomycetota bacterium]
MLLGCLVVAAVLLATDVVLASTFRSFILGRVDQQVVQASDPLVHGRFRGGFGSGRLGGTTNTTTATTATAPTTTATTATAPTTAGGSTPTTEQRIYTEYYIGLVAADGTVSRLGPGLQENDESEPKLSATTLAGHLSPSPDELRPFTVPSSTGGGKWRVVVVKRTGGEDGTLIFGARLNDMDATLGRMLAVEAVATGLVLAALAAMALWVLRLGVRPLAHMAETAGAIAAGDLSQRVEHADERTEAGQLGAALNAMLEQIEGAFDERAVTEERLRQFVADASHELRTPLTSILANLELLEAELQGEDAEIAGAALRSSRRMRRLVADLLLLARADAGRVARREPLDAGWVVREAAGEAAPLALAHNLSVDVPTGERLV